MNCPECKREQSDQTTNCYYCNTPLPAPEYTISDDKPHVIHAEGKLPIVELTLDGRNGLRVMWNGPHQATVEMKDEDGIWVEMAGIQSIEVIMDCTEPLPQVKINQVIIPGKPIKKLSSYCTIDEPEGCADNPFEE